MINKAIKHFQQICSLLSSHSFDDKSVIRGEEEERTTLASSFSCCKDPIDVVFDVNGVSYVIWSYAVVSHNNFELFFRVTYDLTFDIKRLVHFQILFVLMRCVLFGCSEVSLLSYFSYFGSVNYNSFIVRCWHS